MVCNRLAECQLDVCIATQEVKGREHIIEVLLPAVSSILESEPNDEKRGQPPDGVAVSMHDASKANVALEPSECEPECIEHSEPECIEQSTHAEDVVDVSESATELQAAAEVLVEQVSVPASPTVYVKRVRFDLDAISVHEVTPYAEIYGAHPRTFVFGVDSQMVAAGRGGFNSADFTITLEDEPEDDEESEMDEDDGGWESWLLEQESEDFEKPALLQRENEDYIESDRAPSPVLVHETWLPDLDDEAGWEIWLESTLGHSLDEFCDDTIQCPEERAALSKDDAISQA